MRENLPLSESITPTCLQERRKMDRLDAFEKMLSDIKEQSEYENMKMQELKAHGKKKPPPTGSFSAISLCMKKSLKCTKGTDCCNKDNLRSFISSQVILILCFCSFSCVLLYCRRLSAIKQLHYYRR